jgi:hypothetical protein
LIEQLLMRNFTLSDWLDVDYYEEHLEKFHQFAFPWLNNVGQKLAILLRFNLLEQLRCYFSSEQSTIA